MYSGFHGYRKLPADYGLQDMWEKSTINMTMFYNPDEKLDMEFIKAR